METEDLAKTFTSAMDSVDLINRIVAQDELSDEDVDSLGRNAGHLEIQVEKDFTAAQKKTLQAAIDAANAAL